MNELWTVKVQTKRFGEKSLETRLDLRQAIIVLAGVENPGTFVSDLVANNAKWGLSPIQSNWAIYLAQEELNRAQKRETPAQPVADLTALFDLFKHASEHLKWPKIRLTSAEGRPLVLKLMTRGQHVGAVAVTNGEAYGSGRDVFYGYLNPDGTTTVEHQDVLDTVQALAQDPAGFAAKQGFASGNCVFCGRSLSDSEAGSSDVGYGPVCAVHYNLPWTRNGQAEPVVAPVADQPVKPKRRSRKAKTETVVAV